MGCESSATGTGTVLTPRRAWSRDDETAVPRAVTGLPAAARRDGQLNLLINASWGIPAPGKRVPRTGWSSRFMAFVMMLPKVASVDADKDG